MRRIAFALGAALLLAAAAAHATRELRGVTAAGAYYRIAVPDGWKDGDALVLFQHGLSFEPPGPDPSLGPLAARQLAEGYAIAASSYRQRAWALFTAVDDNADLLAVFRAAVGRPGAILPYGGSLGGLVALKLAEDARFAPVPGVYAGCPPAAGARVWDTAIDLRLAYDVVCKDAGELPTGAAPYPWAYDLADIPPNLSDLLDKARLLETLLPLNQCTGVNLPGWLRNGAMQRRLAQLMNLIHVTDEDFFVSNMGYATYALSDLVRAPDKLGGVSPFGNVGVDYGDAALDAAIARIAPDPFAALYFHYVSDFRGRIDPATRIVSIHTSQDQLVIPANQSVLRQTLPAAQLLSAFVNEAAPSHCGFSDAEAAAGWETLRTWLAGASQPQVGDLEAACTAATAAGNAGPCRFDARVTPPPFDSQVRPRPASTAAPVDARYSGLWYDPARSGEGIALEILAGDRALLFFFTYPPVGAPGQQRWLAALGTVLGNGIEFADVRLPAGAPPGYADTHWGRIGLVFDDCDHGRMRWDGPPGWGSYVVPLNRLTALAGLGCTDGGTPAAAGASGAWYDPARSGSGFLVEQLDPTRLDAIWFGFDAGGAPIWLLGVLDRNADGAYQGTLAQGLGPHFGPDYDPRAFVNLARGTLTIRDLQCAHATATFAPAPGAPALLPSTLPLTRLTLPLGLPGCG
jgi:hypothetical protein